MGVGFFSQETQEQIVFLLLNWLLTNLAVENCNQTKNIILKRLYGLRDVSLE